MKKVTGMLLSKRNDVIQKVTKKLCYCNKKYKCRTSFNYYNYQFIHTSQFPWASKWIYSL